MKDGIEEVTRAFLDALFDSPDYRPRGLFLCEDEDRGQLVFVAVDNRSGEALTEEFLTKYAAQKYLWGKPTVNRWGELLNREGGE